MINKEGAERLSKVLTQILTADANIRDAAIKVFVKSLETMGEHPTTVKVRQTDDLLERLSELLGYYRGRASKHINEINYLRKQVDEKTIGAGRKAQDIEWRWPELENELVRRGLGNGNGDLSPTWDWVLCRMVGTNKRQITRWYEGIELIPDSVLERVRELPLKDEQD